MLEDTLFENSELKKKIEKLEDKIRKQEDKIKSLETAKDKYKREAAAAKGLKVREGISKTSEIS
jgi:predicted ribosome quality control (RQC) complex YloA/Tae2 family protein